MSENPAGTRIAHFQVLSELGRGGMGVVYEARDEKLGRVVALKVLPASLAADRARAGRFLREARAAAQITHPCIATVFEIGESDGRLYIAMERVEGQTLRERLVAGSVSVDEALGVAREIASALGKAHAAGIVHRDLKPENVMISNEGRVKILDFGIAKALDDETAEEGRTAWATREGMILGTPGYMSPEQAAGKTCDQRADVFAFGVLLYELLSNRAPFSGDTPLERVASVLRDAPTPLPEVATLPDGIRTLVERCLQKKPEDRPANGTELSSALEASTPSPRAVVRAGNTEVDPLARTLATPAGGELAELLAKTKPAVTAPHATTTAPSTVEPPSPSGARRALRWLRVAVIIVVVIYAVRYFNSRSSERHNRRTTTTTTAAAPVAPPVLPAPPPPPPKRAGVEMPPVWICDGKPDAGFGFECSSKTVAWCDPDGKPVACCGPGLWPVDANGACGCPPGGVEPDSPAARSCPVVKEKSELDGRTVQAKLREHRVDFRACFVRRGKVPAGRIVVALRISPDGRLYSARIRESNLPSPEAQECLLEQWQKVRFSPPVGVAGVSINFPMEFRRD